MTDLRERVAHEIHLSKWWTGGAHKARRCATRILALFAAERERMREALERASEGGLAASNELMTEFVSKKRAANWGVINEGLLACQCGAALAALAPKEET